MVGLPSVGLIVVLAQLNALYKSLSSFLGSLSLILDPLPAKHTCKLVLSGKVFRQHSPNSGPSPGARLYNIYYSIYNYFPVILTQG
jgi:hypothetical protein